MSNLKMRQYFNSRASLLYDSEEFSHSMNVGDIGRLERTVLSWIPIFKASIITSLTFHLQLLLTQNI